MSYIKSRLKKQKYNRIRFLVVGVFFALGLFGTVLNAYELHLGRPTLIGECDVLYKQLFGLISVYPSNCILTFSWPFKLATTFIKDISPELAGIVIGFVTIDWLNEKRAEEQLKQQLIREAASNDNGIARRAIEELKAQGKNPPNVSWFNDGTLKFAYFYNANLNGVDFRLAQLEGAVLAKAKLVKADLSAANLRGANLNAANLTEAVLHNADLTGATLRFCNLSEAWMYGVRLGEKAILTHANLQRSILEGADLSGAILFGTRLKEANLQYAKLRNVKLRTANLNGAILLEADLTGTKLTEDQLSSILIWDGAIMADGTRLWHPVFNREGPQLEEWIEEQKGSTQKSNFLAEPMQVRITNPNPLNLPKSYQHLPPYIELTRISRDYQDKPITKEQIGDLKNAVKNLSEITGLSYQRIYSNVNRQFNVTSYKHLTQIQFEQALVYIQDEITTSAYLS